MLAATAAPSHYGNARHAAHRVSLPGIVGIVAAHIGVVVMLAMFNIVPMPAQLTPLMVQVISSESPPAPEVVPPSPPKVVPPPPKPVQPVQPRILAAPVEAPSNIAEAPVVEEVLQEPAPAAPSSSEISLPRFDADYLQNPAPVYPSLSRRLGEEGKVVLRVFVEPDGRPSQIEVKDSSNSPRLDRAAQDAVWRWKFVAARRGNEAVGAWVMVPIVFNLRG